MKWRLNGKKDGAMAGKRSIFFLLIMISIAVLLYIPTAVADDADQLKYLPGQWAYEDVSEKVGKEPQEVDVLLTLHENGEMSLFCSGRDIEYTYTGTWSSEFVPDAMDRLTLLFASTSNPLYTESGYNQKCVFDFYTESWVENDTWNIFLLTEENPITSGSPFEEIYGYNNLAMHREQKPNMRVVKCKDFVSLRAEPSASSKRLAKVPLGAPVLAIPGGEEMNGFIWCTYHDEYGWILSEYLQITE